MTRFEARAFVEEAHEILGKAAANPNSLSTVDHDRLIELETAAEKLLNGNLSGFRIIRSDGAGPSDNPLDVIYNSLAEVDRIEIQDGSKMVLVDGQPKELQVKRFTAVGKRYEVPTGTRTTAGHPEMRTTNDSVTSGPEGFIEVDGVYKSYGAASALVARLLEAKASGAF